MVLEEKIAKQKLKTYKTWSKNCLGSFGIGCWIRRSGYIKAPFDNFPIFSYHETFLKAEEECNKVGGYLADVLDEDENNWIKSVLNVINPKDGTDYWLGGLDANRDGDRDHHGMYWMTGNVLNYLFSFQISTI